VAIMHRIRSLRLVGAVVLAAACGGDTTTPHEATPPAPAVRAPVQQPLAGGPYPALFVAQAQFVDRAKPDGGTEPVPGPAKLTIVRRTDVGWTPVVLEDPDSNVFHKALDWPGGFLTIGGSKAELKTWRFADGRWQQETHWQPSFGGKFDRLRDVERGDVDGDGKEELVIATHDQGVIAVVHPDENWRVEQVDAEPNTFVHEIEIGDVDGDGKLEFFATPSRPNKLGQEQPGEVRMYRFRDGKWERSVVDAPGDTHAKEILTADVDGNGVSELYVVWEGAIGKDGVLLKPVTVTQYRMKDGKFTSNVIATVPDRQMRALAAGDVTGDGKIDLVGTSLKSGVWLFEQTETGWKSTLVDAESSGFEHPLLVADLDGDGRLEIYVGAEDQHEVRRYDWKDGRFARSTVVPLHPGDITWNITAGRL
jgi:VCBS repeat protein